MLNLEKRKRRKNETYNPSKKYIKKASRNTRPHKGESVKDRDKRLAFKKRHAKNIKKGKMSAAWWADAVKWSNMFDK